MAELVLVRHGESTYNASGRWQGQRDVPLSERGREQARALAKRFREASFERRVSSDLARARETAEILGGAPEEDSGLREIDVGRWEGLPHAEVATRFPDEVAALRSGGATKIGGGESLIEFAARVHAAIERVSEPLSPDGSAMVVTHGGVIKSLLTGLLGLEGVATPMVGAANTSRTRVEWGARRRLITFNDALHLGAEERRSPFAPVGEDRRALALVAVDAAAAADARLADELMARLRIPKIVATGAAAESPLARTLWAEPGPSDPAALLSLAREEGHVVVLAPREVIPAWLATFMELSPERADAFAPPEHGASTRLSLSSRGAMLEDYGVPPERPTPT